MVLYHNRHWSVSGPLKQDHLAPPTPFPTTCVLIADDIIVSFVGGAMDTNDSCTVTICTEIPVCNWVCSSAIGPFTALYELLIICQMACLILSRLLCSIFSAQPAMWGYWEHQQCSRNQIHYVGIGFLSVHTLPMVMW